MEPKPYTLQAVECAACHELHRLGSSGYVIISQASIDNPIGEGDQVKRLVTITQPTIACYNTECICRVLQVMRDY